MFKGDYIVDADSAAESSGKVKAGQWGGRGGGRLTNRQLERLLTIINN